MSRRSPPLAFGPMQKTAELATLPRELRDSARRADALAPATLQIVMTATHVLSTERATPRQVSAKVVETRRRTPSATILVSATAQAAASNATVLNSATTPTSAPRTAAREAPAATRTSRAARATTWAAAKMAFATLRASAARRHPTATPTPVPTRATTAPRACVTPQMGRARPGIWGTAQPAMMPLEAFRAPVAPALAWGCVLASNVPIHRCASCRERAIRKTESAKRATP